MSSALAWLDGALVPRADARISIDDFAVRYGAACFETMLAVNGRVFRLDRHLARLAAGLREMHVQPPASAALAEAITATLRANGLARAQVRLTVTAGRGGAPDLAVARGPSVFTTADALGDGAAAPVPVRLRVVTTRLDERRPLRGAKVSQFLPYLLARAEARAAGADDALLLNRAGAIGEAATANVFAVHDGALSTPRLEDGPIPGVTREAILECAAALGLPAEERTLTLADLSRADELFLTASLPAPRPVSAVDGDDGLAWRGSAVPGPITSRLAEAYAALVARECGTSAPES